jgi:hypothetical protein
MSAVVVFKGEDGKLQGFGDKGARAWAKFGARVRDMVVGETLAFEWFEPRSKKHHGLFFAKLGMLMDLQEQFPDEETLRKWLICGAGYCDYFPGAKGRMMAIPQSMAWHKMDEADFADLHGKIDAFLWSEHARRFLWPHLTDEQTYETIQQLMQEFEK